jgi:hypothetical protein
MTIVPVPLAGHRLRAVLAAARAQGMTPAEFIARAAVQAAKSFAARPGMGWPEPKASEPPLSSARTCKLPLRRRERPTLHD